LGDLATTGNGHMKVSILAYDGCMGAEVLGFADVLHIANRINRHQRPDAPQPFEVAIVGVREGLVTLAGGMQLAVKPPGRTDLLVVPAFDFARMRDIDGVLAGLTEEVALIRRVAKKKAAAAICGGVFLLAEAGLLDGRRATTAWMLAPAFARRYPDVRLEHAALVVRDGDVLTAGAFQAYADLALMLVRDNADDWLAGAVGRFALIDAGRASQTPYIDPNLIPKIEQAFSDAVSRRLEVHLRDRYDLEALARRFNVSSRTLLRRFKAETGATPLERLQDLRIAEAKRLLEGTRLGVAQIAERVGYLDLSTFSRLFARKTSTTPAAYRRRFRPAPLAHM
jgi:transcriptional regulator GlxA family with amidase domain